MTRTSAWRLLLGGILASAVFAELGLRATGYGAPLIYASDPDIEYLLLPNQRTHRFETRLETNRFGMRSADFDPTGDQRRRVLVLGDSVVNGGNWTDQDALATSRLASDGDLLVLNVSAGGWGPGNLLAYVERYGAYNASDIVVVLSSDDWTDDRSFSPLHGYETPDRLPALALWRLTDQYLLAGPARESARTRRPARNGDAAASLRALFARLAGERSCIVLHWTSHELSAGADPAMGRIVELATANRIPIVDTAARYRSALARGERVYRDDIHPTAAGQAILTDAMRECLN